MLEFTKLIYMRREFYRADIGLPRAEYNLSLFSIHMYHIIEFYHQDICFECHVGMYPPSFL